MKLPSFVQRVLRRRVKPALTPIQGAKEALIVRAGIPLDKQAFVGGVLALIAIALHCVMGGRLLPWKQ